MLITIRKKFLSLSFDRFEIENRDSLDGYKKRSNYTEQSGLYSAVRLTPKSTELINDFCEQAGFDSLNEKSHCTIMYSHDKVASDFYRAHQFGRNTYNARAERFKWWAGGNGDGYLVLLLESPELKEEHNRLRQLGCTPTLDDYTPHVTIMTPIQFESEDECAKFIRYGNLLLRRNGPEIQLHRQYIEDINND